MYAAAVERRTLRGTRRTPAHPFFWPAFRLMRKRATNRIKRAVSKAVRDNWGRP